MENNTEEHIPVDQDQCDSCGFETKKLQECEGPPTNREARFWFCDLCYNSFASNTVIYPSQYSDGGVLRHISYIGNVILQKLEKN